MKKFEKDSRHDEIHASEYDEKGNKIARTLTYPNKNRVEHETWKYDEKGNMTEWKEEGALYRTYGYTYEYDSQGNWTKRTQVENNYEEWNTKTKKMDYRDNVPVAIATRTIEYY